MAEKSVDGKNCILEKNCSIMSLYKSRSREIAEPAFFLGKGRERCGMIQVFKEQTVMTVCMFSCMALGIFLKVFLGILYGHMIKETDNMAATENKLLKQCKTKFSNCYELNNGISNIPVFVDRFLNRMALGPFSFALLYHLSGQLMLLSVVCSGVGVCRSILAGHTLGAILPFYIVSFLSLYVYFSVSSVVDVQGKRKMLKVNLIDYLENHLSPRIRVTRKDLEMLYGDASFQEKPAAIGENGTARSGRGRTGRRTVELMPFGTRTPVAESAQLQETQNDPEAGNYVPARDAAVTEEELETLLREFLTG